MARLVFMRQSNTELQGDYKVDLARYTYANGRHFTSSIEFKYNIKDKWYEIDAELSQKLVSYIKARIFEVIRRKASYTSFQMLLLFLYAIF